MENGCRINQIDQVKLKEQELINQAKSKEFDEQFAFKGELGVDVLKESTRFRLWAPLAEKVNLIIFEGYYGEIKEIYPMKRFNERGVFEYQIPGNQHGLTYLYALYYQGIGEKYTVDPYAKAVTVNGARGVVVDLSKTNPKNWGERYAPFDDVTTAAIYETHIRDFSIAPNSGMKNKGKYLAFTENATTNPEGYSTGVAYLKELGITHLELQPFMDYKTVDETQMEPHEYNWGYDPEHYFVPEGSYSTQPYDPFNRIIETKQMIQNLHDSGIRVIMDVVLNHVYQQETHPFQMTAPGYFFRYNADGELSNGTGVGNDTASERAMMRRYIIDCLVYWATEYHIDGFRMDLLGIHDIDTINQLRQALDEIDPTILLFGEGWNLPTALPDNQKAILSNSDQLPHVGFFNDHLRHAIKGDDFNAHDMGFVNGNHFLSEMLVMNLAGQTSYPFLSPLQMIQYFEAHDNYTLYDRLRINAPFGDDNILECQQMLAMGLLLIAPGIPFIHSGQEFLRSKEGHRNTYNLSDAINQIDWQRQNQYYDTVQFTKALLTLRRQEPLLRPKTLETIQQQFKLERLEAQFILYRLEASDRELLIAINGKGESEYLHLQQNYQVLMHHYKVLEDTKIVSEAIEVAPYSISILKKSN